MGQIIKSVCVCQSVSASISVPYLSICEHSHGRISSLIFTKIHSRNNPQK